MRRMEFQAMQQRAMAIRQRYAALEQVKFGRSWSREEIAMGFVGDVGDLMKLLTAKSGIRDIPDADEKLAHELADCLWAVIVLAEVYGVDLERVFLTTMDDLETHIASQK